MNTPVASLVLVPFAAAVAAFLGGRRTAPVLLGATAVSGFASLALLARALWAGGAIRCSVGGWDAPLGIELHLDGLSLLMLIALWPVTTAVGLQAWRRGVEPLFWPLLFACWGTLNVLFISADVFNLYVALELLTLCSVTIISRSGSEEALAAALRYLLAAVLGSAAYLFGVGLLYGTVGSLALPDLAGLASEGAGGRWAVGLILAGLLLKAAAFPLHFWLPPAYLHALPPGDALFAALGSKAVIYLIIRLWPGLTGGPEAGSLLALALGVLGSAAVLWGSLMALRVERLKELLAFSSISQTGYLLLLFSMGWHGTAHGRLALGGAAMLLLSHTWASAAMFMAAEAVTAAAGSDRISELNRAEGRPALAVYAFGLGGVSLIGLPPSGGFVAKWLLLRASFESGNWWWIPTLALGGLLTAGYVFRVLQQAVVRHPGGQPAAEAAGGGPHLIGFLLASTAILLGLTGIWPLELLWRGGVP
jgi:formate hydrogenlyase subunit 3/multisubunit Na+/H+ antiporter MnhD subunit